MEAAEAVVDNDLGVVATKALHLAGSFLTFQRREQCDVIMRSLSQQASTNDISGSCLSTLDLTTDDPLHLSPSIRMPKSGCGLEEMCRLRPLHFHRMSVFQGIICGDSQEIALQISTISRSRWVFTDLQLFGCPLSLLDDIIIM